MMQARGPAYDHLTIERRRCGKCQASAAMCRHVTVHRLNGIIPLGTTFRYACEQCSAEFTLMSVGRTIGQVLTGFMMLLIGWIGFAVKALGAVEYGVAGWRFSDWAALIVLAVMAVLGPWQLVSSARSTYRWIASPVARR